MDAILNNIYFLDFNHTWLHKSCTAESPDRLLRITRLQDQLFPSMPQSLQTWDEGDEHKSMESTAVADPEFIAVDKCLAAATFGLNFDIAELWRLAPDTSSRDTGVNTSSSTRNPSKPTCEHVYAEPATLKTYTGRIMGIWNSGFEDSRALQQHVLSPDVRRTCLSVG